jgi:hypothetical protein
VFTPFPVKLEQLIFRSAQVGIKIITVSPDATQHCDLPPKHAGLGVNVNVLFTSAMSSLCNSAKVPVKNSINPRAPQLRPRNLHRRKELSVVCVNMRKFGLENKRVPADEWPKEGPGRSDG